MLYALIGLIVIGCLAVMMNEGVYSAAIILICTVIGGLLAFNFFEPVAELLEGSASFLVGYGDAVAILVIFALAVTALRLVTEQLAPEMVEFPDLVHRGGGIVIGAGIGWIVAGILLAAVQTLPLHREFLGYNYRDLEKPLPLSPDRYWLAFVHRCSQKVFEQQPARAFDPNADFCLRYHRYRRTDEEGRTLAAPAGSDRPPARGSRDQGRGDRGGGRRGT